MAVEISDLVGDNGRVNHRLLKQHIAETRREYFLAQFPHPMLVGKELYDGEITKNTSSTMTMKFHKSTVMAQPGPASYQQAAPPPSRPPADSGITSAIYMLRKKAGGALPPNVVGIGRSIDNDLTIADYSISQLHAHLIIFHGMYFVTDVGSTNGTTVNEKLIRPQQKVKIEIGNNIGFGRIVFVFMDSGDLYDGLEG